MHECGDCDGQESVKEKPGPAEVACGEAHYGVGAAQDNGPKEPYRCGQGLGLYEEGLSKEGCGEKGEQGEECRDYVGWSEHALGSSIGLRSRICRGCRVVGELD
jgi:hypothetical protein